jgi:hypothetical protein
MRCKENGLLPEIAFSDDSSFADEEKEGIRRAMTKMLQLNSNARPTATDLVIEFSSSHERTILVAQPQHIHIYEEFRSIRHEGRTTNTDFTSATQAEFRTTQTEIGTTRQENTTSAPDYRFSGIRALSMTDKEALVSASIENDRSSFWVWHARSTLYAHQDNLHGAIEEFEKEFLKSQADNATNPAISMELMNLHAVRSDYEKAIEYGNTLLRMCPTQVRDALVVFPKDPQILGIIQNFESKKKSLDL